MSPPVSANISTRVSLRWPPEPAFETTDTASLSVGGWYVDLRIELGTGKVDWAMAGQRIVERESSSVVVFTHVIDSLQLFDAADRGTFETLPNGDELETGKMSRLDLPGAPMRDYEEVWRKIDVPEAVPEGRGYSWVLESEAAVPHATTLEGDNKGEVKVAKTFLGRVPGHYIALSQLQWYKREKIDGQWTVTKTGGEVSGRRETWDARTGVGAVVRYAVGDEMGRLPSLISTGEALKFDGEGEEAWRTPGRTVIIDDIPFVVRAFVEFPPG